MTLARLGEVIRLGVILLFFVAAPVAGDIGGCCQAEDDLDPEKFFGTKQAVDCQRCTECGIATAACERACSPGTILTDFPVGCVPLAHDGEVCLDALLAAACSDYRVYMSDEVSTIPTECDFCPLAEAPHPTSDAGEE